jgi:predicted aspartyl protease
MVLVPVRVNGKPLTFILDSGGGSPGLLLDAKAANDLKLKREGALNTFGAGENRAVVVPLVHGLDVEFAGKHSSATAGIFDFSPVSHYIRTHVDGLLGTNAFSHAVIEIDYCRQEIQVIEPTAAVAAPRDAIIVGITRLAGLYASQATIQFTPQHQVSGLFLLDTGAGPVAFALTRDQARHAPVPEASLRHDKLPAAGGSLRATLVPSQSVTIGGRVFQDVTIHLAENTSGGMDHGDYLGVIGGEFFRRFVAVFDVPHQRLILSPAEDCRYTRKQSDAK